jgi:hypothetical protein
MYIFWTGYLGKYPNVPKGKSQDENIQKIDSCLSHVIVLSNDVNFVATVNCSIGSTF